MDTGNHAHDNSRKREDSEEYAIEIIFYHLKVRKWSLTKLTVNTNITCNVYHICTRAMKGIQRCTDNKMAVYN